MHGALLFTAVVVIVLWLGTYLLQGALVLLRVGLVLVWEALKILAGLAAFVVIGVWWLFDRRGGGEMWRAASAAARPELSAGPRPR